MPPSLSHSVLVIEYPDALQWSVQHHWQWTYCPRFFYWANKHPELAPPANVNSQPHTTAHTSQLSETAWALRHLTTLPDLVNAVVRRTATIVLHAVGESERVPSLGALLDNANLRLQSVWLASTSRVAAARFWQNPGAATPLLQEFALGPGLPESALDEAREDVRRMILTLQDHPVLESFWRARRRPYLIGSFGEPFPIGKDIVGWCAPDVVFQSRPRRGGSAPRHARWVIGHFAFENDLMRSRLEVYAAARWLVSSARHYQPSDEVESWLMRLDGGSDRREAVRSQDLCRFDETVAAHCETLVSAGDTSTALAGRPPGAFPMTADVSRCAACRFDSICASERGYKDGQPALGIPRMPSRLTSEGSVEVETTEKLDTQDRIPR
jgi:hypothetical protein